MCFQHDIIKRGVLAYSVFKGRFQPGPTLMKNDYLFSVKRQQMVDSVSQHLKPQSTAARPAPENTVKKEVLLQEAVESIL